jgi:exo-1,4-beta-D-glucosaminidase
MDTGFSLSLVVRQTGCRSRVRKGPGLNDPTGKWLDREEFFEKTDRLGILVMPGWTCCDAWEQWKDWGPEQHEVAMESLASQIRILRKHPSVFVWLNGSDNPPPADIEKSYLDILSRLRWPNPVLSSASGQAAT